MGGAMLRDCSVWLAMLAGAFALVVLLLRVNGSRPRLRRLWSLHRDESGSAQSLSFVLTLPLFVMVMLFIVQVSQLMIGTIVVHYAAFATARSAIVWIPAGLEPHEWRNCISTYHLDPEADDQMVPILDPSHEDYGPAEGGLTFIIDPGTPKYDKIKSAAVLACASISPSRDLGFDLPGDGVVTAAALEAAYRAMDPDSQANTKIPVRLRNKLAYAMNNTEIEIRFFHKNSEPPLWQYEMLDPRYPFFEFNFNELGWQDPVTVKVKHNLALLPGPGRLLARPVANPDGSPDEVADSVGHNGRVYVYPLEASATLGLEGEKSMVPYDYRSF